MLRPTKLLSTAAVLALMAGGAMADVSSGYIQSPAQNTWVIMGGTSLKVTLEGWTKVAGWTLIWDSPVDYRMRASATFRGDFEHSASKLIDSIYIGNPELSATFHRGNKVLHITNQPLSSN